MTHQERLQRISQIKDKSVRAIILLMVAKMREESTHRDEQDTFKMVEVDTALDDYEKGLRRINKVSKIIYSVVIVIVMTILWVCYYN